MGNYYLGLDMGTNSIGWAVTTSDYELVRKHGKDMWGIREFEEANTSIARRINRTSRRRLRRENERLGLLKTYFADEIEKIDKDFFARLENSKYFVEDKNENVRYKYGLFNDSTYTDYDYYKEFPTIFHLRKELIENTGKHDVRLVYLAIANMFKHRGHFLNDNISVGDETQNMQILLDRFVELSREIVIDPDTDKHIEFDMVNSKQIEDILSDRTISRSAKYEELRNLFNIEKRQKNECEYLKCLCGLKVDARKLFPTLEKEDKLEVCFNDFNFEEKVPEIIDYLGDEFYSVIEVMKAIYDAGILSSILKGSQYLSISRVEEYEKHKSDLKLLKACVRKYCSKEEYDKLFRSDEPGTYSAYVNFVKTKSLTREDNKVIRRRNMKSRRTDDLYETIKKTFKSVKDDESVDYILNEINNENFLPKQLTASNGVIPNEVHKIELIKILTNAENYLEFLKEKDEYGLTVTERIIQLFSFTIPYYVGPLSENSEKNGGNGWVVRKESGRVLPWNYKDKIDIGKTSEKFITKMVRDCTYVRGEKVLPKASLMYESFCVLNEINNIKINGEKISVELKQSIYNDLFKKGKKVTRKQLEKYLINRNVIDVAEQITGVDTSINNSLSAYGKFKSIFGEDLEKDSIKASVEEIIRLATIFGESKSLLKEYLEREFSNILSAEDIKRILGFKFKDWGRLSKEFLELQGASIDSGEVHSLIGAMWNYNYNLQELLYSDSFTFKEALNDRITKATTSLNTLSYEDLDEFYYSAPVKRMIWQTVLVVNEIIQIMGCEPEKIFVEMTRTEEEKGEKGRTRSRKEQFLELYKNVREEEKNWKDIIEETDNNGKLKSKKMYLYLTQMGRDMYTGKAIDLDKLFDDNIYDIDHIYPRSLVKDDSINNNLVLVNKTDNIKKTNNYPIDLKIASNPQVRELWNTLHDKKMISDEKYNRLTSRKEFSEEQLAGFIARQLVETSQAAKGVADILKNCSPNSIIVYSKAGNVSEFRKDFGMLKSRLVNEFHHANDAYLNIVVGNVYNVKFTNNPLNFIKKDYAKDSKKYAYNLGKMFTRDVKRGNSVAWVAGEAGTIMTVKKTMAKTSPLMTRMVEDGSGELYNLQPISHMLAKESNYAPLKSDLICMKEVSKYGGYGSLKPAYFVFLEYGKNNKRKKAFDVVPMVKRHEIKNENQLKEYFESQGYENVRVIVNKIKKYSLLRIDGYELHIVGMDSRKNVEFHNAVNLKINNNLNNYIHAIEKSINLNSVHKDITREENLKLYEFLKEKYSKGKYKYYPKDYFSVLNNGTEKFINLTIGKQIEVLYKILSISSISGKITDLKDIDGPSSDVGRIRISGNMTDKKDLKLIRQSITGICEQTIDLLKV